MLHLSGEKLALATQMKRISLGMPIDMTDHPKNGSVIMGEYETAYHNGSQVVIATLYIERNLETLIAMRYARKGGLKEFEDRILRTSWCSFDAKRVLVIDIAKEEEILSRDKYEALDKMLRQIGEYRNAFAHGRTVMDKGGFEIHYYKQGKKFKELNDDFFVSIGKLFSEAGKLCNECTNAFIQKRRKNPEK